jgi:hypothetical protein
MDFLSIINQISLAELTTWSIDVMSILLPTDHVVNRATFMFSCSACNFRYDNPSIGRVITRSNQELGGTMRKISITGSLLLTMLIFFACSLPLNDMQKIGTVRVEPVELFSGEGKKFASFLGSMSGAVKVTYTGEKSVVKVYAEVWEAGVRTQVLGPMLSEIRWPEEKKQSGEPWIGEFIVALEQLEGDNPYNQLLGYNAKTAIVHDHGTISTTFRIDSPADYTFRMPIPLGEVKVLSEDEEITVWGMQSTNENQLRSAGLDSDTWQDAKWMLVFKVALQDQM